MAENNFTYQKTGIVLHLGTFINKNFGSKKHMSCLKLTLKSENLNKATLNIT